MKLKEFIEVVAAGNNDNVIDGTLYGQELLPYKDIIKKCDEFSGCDSLDILTMSLVKGNNGEIYTTQTIKLSDLMKFKGRCYLLSLALTPTMYDPKKLLTPVKNGAGISPTIYNPETFEPYKHIILTWSPEMAQDLSGTNHEDTIKNDIRMLLDDVLANPTEYQIKGDRGVMVRGLFEEIEGSDTTKKSYDIDLNANKPEDVGYKVFYLEQKVIKPGEIELKLNNKVIPSHLKDKFIDEVGTDPKVITEKIIDDFLENQGLNRYTGRLAEILKKNKEVEDKMAELDKYHIDVKKLMELTKESKND